MNDPAPVTRITGTCELCLKRYRKIRHTGLRWLCTACWAEHVRPDVPFTDDTPKDAA